MIELMVAIGLMSIMMYMIATIFYQATRSFMIARAGVEVHQNARAAYGMMVNDFAAAKLSDYEDKRGYFALSWERSVPYDASVSTNLYPYNYTPAITFTTLADQAGAVPLVPGVSPQVALVRYCLEWDGGTATVEDDDPLTPATKELSYTRPTYNLMKRVRFPRLPYYYVDMDEFEYQAFTGEDLLADEVVTSDVLAMGVISMKVRMYYKGDLLDAMDHGYATVTDSGGAHILDAVQARDGSDKAWNSYTGLDSEDVRILSGYYAPEPLRGISGVPSATQLSIANVTGYTGQSKCAFRIEQEVDSHLEPTWIELQDRGFNTGSGDYDANSFGAANMLPMRVVEYTLDGGGTKDKFRMPYIVEVTLELTDQKYVTRKIFTERFHIPASEYKD